MLYIAQEIMSSEKTFVSVLKLLNVDFRAAVQQASEEHHSKSILPDSVMGQILKYLPELHQFNKDLLRDLRHRVKNWYVLASINAIIQYVYLQSCIKIAERISQ